MAKYTKKAITVEATQYERGMEDGFTEAYESIGEGVRGIKKVMKPYLQTLEGKSTFDTDVYIVTGIKGERWAVRKDIFEEAYELLVEESEDNK